eukprot:gene7977-1423_t
MPYSDLVGIEMTERKHQGVLVLTCYSYPGTTGDRPGCQHRRSLRRLLFCHLPGDPLVQAWVSGLSHKTGIQCSAVLCPSPSSCARVVAVFINPIAGHGKALQLYRSTIQGLLLSAGLSVEAYVSKSRGHIQQMVGNLPLDRVRCLVAVGGDGTLHEIFNGLLLRCDWEQARHKPVCVVPAGSGNALAVSLGLTSPEAGVWTVIQGTPMPLDIASVWDDGTDGSQRTYSFLILEYGSVADSDVSLDCLRFLGDLRFVIGTLGVLAMNRRYPADLYVLPGDGPVSESRCLNSPTCPGCLTKPPPDYSGGPAPRLFSLEAEQDQWVHHPGDFPFFMATLLPAVAKDTFPHPHAHLCNGLMDLSFVAERSTRSQNLKVALACSDGSFPTSVNTQAEYSALPTSGMVVPGQAVLCSLSLIPLYPGPSDKAGASLQPSNALATVMVPPGRPSPLPPAAPKAKKASSDQEQDTTVSQRPLPVASSPVPVGAGPVLKRDKDAMSYTPRDYGTLVPASCGPSGSHTGPASPFQIWRGYASAKCSSSQQEECSGLLKDSRLGLPGPDSDAAWSTTQLPGHSHPVPESLNTRVGCGQQVQNLADTSISTLSGPHDWSSRSGATRLQGDIHNVSSVLSLASTWNESDIAADSDSSPSKDLFSVDGSNIVGGK